MCSLLPRTNIIRHCPWGGHQRDDWRMEWYWWRIPFDKVTFSLSLSRLLSLLTCHEIVRVLLGDRLALENSKLEHTLSHHVTIPNSQSTQEVSPLSSKCGHVHRCRYGESSMFSPRSLSVCVSPSLACLQFQSLTHSVCVVESVSLSRLVSPVFSSVVDTLSLYRYETYLQTSPVLNNLLSLPSGKHIFGGVHVYVRPAHRASIPSSGWRILNLNQPFWPTTARRELFFFPATTPTNCLQEHSAVVVVQHRRDNRYSNTSAQTVTTIPDFGHSWERTKKRETEREASD